MRLLTLLTLLLATGACFGQQNGFSPTGRASLTQPSTGYKGSATWNTDSVTNKTMTDEQFGNFKDALRPKIAAAYSNLNDPNLGLKALYTYLWGKDDYDQLNTQLQSLNTYFSDKKNPAVAYTGTPILPVDTDFEGLKKSILWEVDPKKGKNQLTVDLYQTDPFQKWLIDQYSSRYKKSIGAAVTRNKPASLLTHMNIDYLAAWRQLEAIYAQIADTIEDIARHQSDIRILCRDETAFLNATQKALDDNPLVHELRNNKEFFEYWLWLNEGILTINPLRATTDDLLYPAGESYRLKENLKTTMPPPPTLDQVLQAKKLFNRVVLPFSREKEVTVLHFDYGQVMKNRANLVLDTVLIPVNEHDPYMLCVHNVPQDIKVQIAYTSTPLPSSKILEQLSSGADGLNTLISIYGQLSGFWGTNIAPLVTIPATKPTPVVIQSQQQPPQPPAPTGGNPHFRENLRTQVTQASNSSIKRPLLAGLLTCDCRAEQNLLDTFLYRDNCITAPAANDPLYPQQVADLRARWRQFELDATQAAADTLIKNISKSNIFLALQGLLKIPDRSLPPVDIAVKTSTAPPVYHTHVDHPALVGQTEVNYTLTSTATGKTDKSDPTQVFMGTFLVNKKSLFRLSLGFGYTFNNYIRNEPAAAGNQVSVTNDNAKAKMVFGLNIYPWGLLTPDDKFMGLANGHELNRLSVFLGLGVPTPLENYYFGLGYDLIPGLKIQGGAQAFYYTKNQISNNTIITQSNGVRWAGFFASLNLDVNFVAKLINGSK